MASKLVLIDGHSILNRAFYGVPDLTNSEGLHTNAIYGFLNIMFKVIEEENPSYLTIAFDLKAPTFRHKMYKEYKGTRKPMPDELRQQVPVIKELLAAMNIQTIELEGYEADDLIGTLAKKAENDGLDVSIVSGDRDLLQLATEKITVRIPKTKGGKTQVEDYKAEDVKNLYSVTPLEFIDLKALMGDTADNIPGVSGIGEKTAMKIISQYHSIENAMEHIDEITPPKAKNNLKKQYDIAKLSKELATININVPVETDYKTGTLEGIYNENALKMFRYLEFKSYITKFQNNTTVTGNTDIKKITCEYTFKQLMEYIEACPDNGALGICVREEKQTVNGLIFEDITRAAVASEDFIYILNITAEELAVFLRLLKEKNMSISTFDLKSIIKLSGLYEDQLPDNIVDCTICAYLLNPLKDSYDPLQLAFELCNISFDISSEDAASAASLAAAAYSAFLISHKLTDSLKEKGMADLYKNIELPLVFSLAGMETAGIKVNAGELKAYGELLQDRIYLAEQDIYNTIGTKFNINSPKQLGEILFEKMGLPGGKKTKTGYSTSAEVLEKLAPDYPVVNRILEYRQLTKLKSTYADGLATYISQDGRIHGKFNQTITATGRISSTEPNLQNIPIRMDLGKAFRKVFIPDDDCIFIDADYSQIELRILAHMSGDQSLIDAYNSHCDIHAITASKVFNTPFEQVTPEQRRNAKAVNFGIVYGISSFGLSQDLSITRKQAAEYIKQYFETYPGVKKFLDDTVKKAKEQGFVKTMFGRIRPVPELQSGNFMKRSFGERVAMNSPIQGTAADIMKIAMINVDRCLRDKHLESRIVLQVHDELLLEVKNSERDIVTEIIKDSMSHAADLKVPLETDIGYGLNWLEAH